MASCQTSLMQQCRAPVRRGIAPKLALRPTSQTARCTRVYAADLVTEISPDASIQLASAKLPKHCTGNNCARLGASRRATNADAFVSGMYQWAATLTVSGQNLPLALPLQADRTDNGYDIIFLRVVKGDVFRIAKIESCVEKVGEDNVLMIRFKAGATPFPDGGVPKSSSEKELLGLLLDRLVDVPLLMGTMKDAIPSVAAASLEN